jgi:hypothetical protein
MKLAQDDLRGNDMPITPYLQERHTFDPDDVKVMSEAFTVVCDALGLKERDDPATRLIARRIIEHAESGVRSPSALQHLVLKEYQQTP